MARYTVEGWARRVGALGIPEHVVCQVEADDEKGAVLAAYERFDHWQRAPNSLRTGDDGPLYRVTRLAP